MNNENNKINDKAQITEGESSAKFKKDEQSENSSDITADKNTALMAENTDASADDASMTSSDSTESAYGSETAGSDMPDISEGYIADTELEERLKKELSAININEEKEKLAISAEKIGRFKPASGNDNIFRYLPDSMKDAWGRNFNLTKKNFLYPALFIIISLIYLELAAHFLIYRGFDNKIIYPILFAIPL